MMEKIFLQIVNMSITSCYVILAVILLRLLLKKTPKIYSYALWSVVLFRLICPFSFENVFSFISINTRTIPQDIVYTQTPQIHSGITVIDRVVNNSLPVPPTGASVNPIGIWITLGKTIWLIGLAILITYSIFTAVKLSKRLKTAELISDNIYEARNIDTPFVFGIINPKIYLPSGLSNIEKSYIIKHEEVHIKRFDHIIKPFSFLVLSVHWFNPLVWLGFYLMSKDMELSCDEKVIKEMGSGIKKDYSSSLLSLSTGRRLISGSPLAFGENNTKSRIKNILNYRKPRFWVSILGIVVIVVAGIGLLSNPKGKEAETNNPIVSEGLTIEEYAEKYLQEEIKMYEKSFKIVDGKVTKLERLASFNDILPYPIELWSIEYRLKPEDINNVVIAGGMGVVDGWITEESSMGKPTLVFGLEGENVKYLGKMNTVEYRTDSLSNQEISLRIFLENIGLLSNESYKGNHVVIKFSLSTGETSQLLLSQPVVQGEKGIWAVERWMDGNGTVYHEGPNTELRIEDYYNELQKQFDSGENLKLGDPVEVGYDFIINYLGQILVKKSDLVVIDPAAIDDFMNTPISHYIGYISDFTQEERYFHLDRVEFLGLEDEERLKELNIDPDEDMPSGFYIHNPHSYPDSLFVSEETEYYILDWENLSAHKKLNKLEFAQHLDVLSYDLLFHVYTKDGYVTKIEEQYIP